ncbi:Macrolide export protein MacA [anaerobic digester metagenome]|uniref:Macrolide export protein MacA n=1 Tax=anaerobic digester metagenome TaxID=1263854 RepID=A0A485M1P8_9ZZZZ
MKRFISLALILLFVALIGGCGKKTVTQEEEVLVPVEIAKTQLADLTHTLNTTGEIIPFAEVAVAPKVSGRVAAIHVKVGDRVSRGQVLLELDATEARNAKTMAEAGVGVARANLNKAKQGLADAELDYNRTKALYDSQAVAKAQFEQAESMLNNARIGVELAGEQLKQAEATLQNAEETYNNFTVTSPLSGLVATVNIENGELAGPQATALTVVELATVKVKVNLSENAVVSIKKGAEVPVTINSLNKTLTGTVASVAPKADPATRAFPVEIHLNNKDGDLKAGMVAVLDLQTGLSQGTVTVPVDALLERDGQYWVYVLEDGKAKEVTVKKGITDGQLVEITEGLQEGQDVIVSGNHLVTDGQRVKVVDSQGGASN